MAVAVGAGVEDAELLEEEAGGGVRGFEKEFAISGTVDALSIVEAIFYKLFL